MHGTNVAYVEGRLDARGKYCHSSNEDGCVEPVYLTTFPDSAIDYARRRSCGRLEQAVVLIILTQNIRHKLRRVFLHPVVDDLAPGEFIIHTLGDSSMKEEIGKIREAVAKLDGV